MYAGADMLFHFILQFVIQWFLATATTKVLFAIFF